ncbi:MULTISPECIES: LCP family protein [Bacillus]|uniref:LCP family protein n=1 Tax=Bacillus TaxID=1386 RepID=UPI0001CE3622|nr:MULTISPECIES: LCP family protein [Bacillus]GFZ68403.1 putative transcriptional regulator YwtF [Pseudomonas amygdali pv. eriobotryae]AMK74090.1 LytR family transcriptional regulator [Bacillus subtilis subsp. natto]AOS69679.1 LytR family transcriptional regulator [Bacillus subtilis]API43802.1 LytR family transcriptional regulator [Bacillus subtilis]API97089.1 LytR family transcriptional regulator [Bacillus subtilis]
MEERLQHKKKKRRLKKWVKFTIGLFAILIIVTGSIGTYAYIKLNNASKQAHIDLNENGQSVKRIKEFDPKKDSFTVLLLGIDSRNSKGETVDDARSDANVLVTFNRKNKSATMLSIPRDSYVNIPGYGYDKFTHAHAYGGVKLSAKTIENLLDIPVDYVIESNFDAFKDVVDELNGVSINVKNEKIVNQIKKDTKGKVTLKTGVQTLNGEEALAYVRTRKADTDFQRGQRQMEVLNAIIKKSKSLSSIPAYDDIVDSLGENLKMNLSLNDAIGLFPFITSLKSVDTEQLTGSDMYLYSSRERKKLYYLKLDSEKLEEVKTELKNDIDN